MNKSQDGSNQGGGEDRRSEYNALRAEILYSDQVCIIITGGLLSGSLALLTFAIQTLGRLELAALLSPAWLVGYWYISEKRFVIETIAMYMRQRVEQHSGFGWENWLRTEHQGRAVFRRVFPFYIESIVSCTAVILLPCFLLWESKWRRGWGFWFSVIFVVPMLVVVYRNVRAYAKTR
jgi:hypothetical protein